MTPREFAETVVKICFPDCQIDEKEKENLESIAYTILLAIGLSLLLFLVFHYLPNL